MLRGDRFSPRSFFLYFLLLFSSFFFFFLSSFFLLFLIFHSYFLLTYSFFSFFFFFVLPSSFLSPNLLFPRFDCSLSFFFFSLILLSPYSSLFFSLSLLPSFFYVLSLISRSSVSICFSFFFLLLFSLSSVPQRFLLLDSSCAWPGVPRPDSSLARQAVHWYMVRLPSSVLCFFSDLPDLYQWIADAAVSPAPKLSRCQEDSSSWPTAPFAPFLRRSSFLRFLFCVLFVLTSGPILPLVP